MKRSDFHRSYGESNKQAFKQIIETGNVPGILAYFREQPVGWCSVAPREQFPALDRSPTLKRVDHEPVWSIVCFFVASPYRRRGVSKTLIEAAIEYARENGAKIIEAYPLFPESSKDPRYERYMGVISTFKATGFEEVIRRSKRRAIVRYTVPEPSG
jgi:GNAT superfamily N-acetyltransferase